jgi:hypothetical protein
MKLVFSKTLLAAAAAATLSTLAPGVAQATGSLVFAPVASSVTQGDSFAVQVRGESFTDNVVGGGFSMSYDRAVLSLASVVVNTTVWDFSSSAGLIDNTTGNLTDVFFNTIAATLPTGNFAIATLNFLAVGEGTSALVLRASPTFPFANDLAEVIEVSFGTGSVNVSAVPEPAAWMSMLLGGLMLPLLRRRSQK